MQDETADLEKCYIKENVHVYCKEHGAMLCVKNDGTEKIWRCIQRINLITGKCENHCFAGCVSYGPRTIPH